MSSPANARRAFENLFKESVPSDADELTSGEQGPATRRVGSRVVKESPRVDVVQIIPSELEEVSKLAAVRYQNGEPLQKVDRIALRDYGRALAFPPDPRPACEQHNIVDCACLDAEGQAKRAAKAAEEKRLKDPWVKEKRQIIELRVYGHHKLADELEAWIAQIARPQTETDVLRELVNETLANRGALKPNKNMSRRRPKIKGLFADKTKSLRVEYQLSTREITRLLDDPEFCKLVQVLDLDFAQSPNMKRWLWEIKNGRAKREYRSQIVHEYEMKSEIRTEIIDGVAHVVTTVPMDKKDRKRVGDCYMKLIRPGTMAEWRNLIPLKRAPFINPRDVSFYKDHAQRNLSAAEMLAKHGEVTEDQIRELENRIIKHALHVRILLPRVKPGARLFDFERELEESWDLELRATGKEISWASVGNAFGGRIHGCEFDEYQGRERGLKTFRTNPRLRESGTEDDIEESALEDDYSDEGAA
jgi:hypothetical protein